jgi:hypothetical protein
MTTGGKVIGSSMKVADGITADPAALPTVKVHAADGQNAAVTQPL